MKQWAYRWGISIVYQAVLILSFFGCEKDEILWSNNECVFMASCPHEGYGSTYLSAACTGSEYDRLLHDREVGSTRAERRAYKGCFEQASNCEEFDSCMHLSQEEWTACSEAGSQSYCKDGVSFFCTQPDDLSSKFFCAEAGLSCSEGIEGIGCGLGECDPDTYVATCEGDVFTHCSSLRQIQVADCGDFIFMYYEPGSDQHYLASNTCGATEDGSLGCIGDGEACDKELFTDHCEEYLMVTCTGGKVARVDCRDVIPGTICSEVPRVSPEPTCPDEDKCMLMCNPENPECHNDMDEFCKDGVITFCTFGMISKADCKQLGFQGCQEYTLPSGTVKSRCIL